MVNSPHDHNDDHDENPNKTDPSAKTVTHIPRVLIVEDDEVLGASIQAQLESLDILAFRETEGKKALTLYNKLRPDLVLIDIGLPDMTGWQVLDAMKEARATFSRLAIIMITTANDPANRLQGKIPGVAGYLIKPFKSEELESVVLNALGRKPRKKV
jgi:two-component system, chemotaxis family, chemotaxis protein CheY